MKKVFGLLAIAVLATSCGVAGLVSTPSEYVTAGKEVSVEKKATNVFGLTPMDTQKEAKAALLELNKKCTDGVTNITTTVSYKAFIVGFEKLEMSGNCK